MVTKKDRRHKGYVTPQATVFKKDLEREGLFINRFYDDWQDYRDGFRDWFKDFKLIKKIYKGNKSFFEQIEKRLQMNQKQKILMKRRRVKKIKLQKKV